MSSTMGRNHRGRMFWTVLFASFFSY
jgi:hypothetical protein